MGFRRALVSTAGLSVTLASLVATGPACSPPTLAGGPLKAPTTGEAFAGVQCSAVRPQTEPDLMAWDSGSRSNLNRLRREGVVAVRYEAKGCNVELELLSNCIAQGATYTFSPYSANEHKLARNANELFAQLPVGAARLSGSLKGDRVLRTDYMLAGQYALPPGTAMRSTQLKGDCARATHVVSAVYVGAFAMGAGESRVMEGSASLLGAGGAAKSSAAIESLGDEGDAEACKASQKERAANDGCAVPLRIGLIALEGAAETAESGAMVNIPAGTFTMGSPDSEGDADEHPQHRVNVAAFAMDVTEVTVAAYARCVSAGRCTASSTMDFQGSTDPRWTTGDSLCTYGKVAKQSHPMNCVDWNQATAYCAWAGKRLPTEEEWEYAARGTDGRRYPWGNEAPGAQLCWDGQGNELGKGNRKSTCAVGSYPAGLFGLRDMAGNVWEWTSSNSSESYAKDRTHSTRVIRGGGWDGDQWGVVRSADRGWFAPSTRHPVLGFRCARTQ